MADARCFCLRVGDYKKCYCRECADNCEPTHKKSLSLNKEWKEREECASGSGSKERFHFLTEEEFSELQEGYKPLNTTKCTRWALNNFEAWRAARANAKKE